MACRNEWLPNICNKPEIKCSDCSFHSFKALNKEAIYDHCWILAAQAYMMMARLDKLFLALPISWKGSLSQYVGRIHRQYQNKERVIVYDYVDQALPMLRRMFQKRVKGYETMGYSLMFKGNDKFIQGKLKLS